MKFENIHASRSGNKILKGVSLEVEKGKLTALIGRNGCGKSTLLGCINGQTSYEGKITINGKDLGKMKPTEKAKTVCVLPQLLPDSPFTVHELVSLGRRPHMRYTSILNDEDKRIVREAIEMAMLTQFSDRPVNRLSGGERQRAFLAMAMAQDAEYIALDEATTFMDAAFEAETYRVLQRLVREKNKCVLAVMHNLTRAVSAADTIAVMKDGVIRAFDNAEAIAKADIIESVFEVKKMKCLYEGETHYMYI